MPSTGPSCDNPKMNKLHSRSLLSEVYSLVRKKDKHSHLLYYRHSLIFWATLFLHLPIELNWLKPVIISSLHWRRDSISMES